MTPVNVVRAAMLGSVILMSVGLLLQVGGAGDDRLFYGSLYGAIALLSGAALVGGYASGRALRGRPRVVGRPARFAAGAALFLVLMLAPRVLLDGVSLGEAAADVATGYLRFGGFPLAAGLVGYVIGRVLRDGPAPARP